METEQISGLVTGIAHQEKRDIIQLLSDNGETTFVSDRQKRGQLTENKRYSLLVSFNQGFVNLCEVLGEETNSEKSSNLTTDEQLTKVIQATELCKTELIKLKRVLKNTP